MDELPAAKKAVRGRMLAARLSIRESERREQSSAICSVIESIPEFGRAPSILFYMPVRGEADILPLLKKSLAQGRRCALPKCAPGGRLRLFFIMDAECDVAPGMWGIPEPVEQRTQECTGEPFSVIMVPGVAFDAHGRRLGYGGGYYDRLLGASGNDSLKIAPAYSMQVLRELPAGPLDGRVNIIVTEEKIIDCRKAGEEQGIHG